MKRRNLFWGSLFLLFAFSLLADGFNVFQTGPSLMRLALTALLFVASMTSLSPLNFFGVLMPLPFALILNAEYLNMTIKSWPVIAGSFLLSIALTLLFKKRRKLSFHTNFKDGNFKESTQENVSGDSIRIESNFNNSSRYVQGNEIRTASLENNFGNLNVYFDNADFHPDGAVIKVDCNFGNMNLFLPKNIQVTNSIEASLGSIKEEFYQSQSGSPRVHLSGDVSFGKVNIRYI